MILKSLVARMDGKYLATIDGHFDVVLELGYDRNNVFKVNGPREFTSRLGYLTPKQEADLMMRLQLSYEDLLRAERDLTKEYGTIRWFGPSWHAPICIANTKVATPVHLPCQYCRKPIVDEDRGITLPFYKGVNDPVTREPYHLRCFKESVGIV